MSWRFPGDGFILARRGNNVGERLMNKFRGLAAVGVLLAAACTPMSEQGWLRIKGAMVESDGRELKRCRLDLLDAATDKRLVGQEVEGRFDIQIQPYTPAQSYYIMASCNGFKEKQKLGPWDTTGPDWKQPLDLGDIVFRRIGG
jgi:hypothetical protein